MDDIIVMVKVKIEETVAKLSKLKTEFVQRYANLEKILRRLSLYHSKKEPESEMYAGLLNIAKDIFILGNSRQGTEL